VNEKGVWESASAVACKMQMLLARSWFYAGSNCKILVNKIKNLLMRRIEFLRIFNVMRLSIARLNKIKDLR